MEDVSNAWKVTLPHQFWGEISADRHILQVYENEEVFISTLTSFVQEGLRSGDAIVLIATEKHISELAAAFRAKGIDVASLKENGQLIILEAVRALELFMRDGRPDHELFLKHIGSVVSAAKKKFGAVRAFGEMVSILWSGGYSGATVELEALWNKFCRLEPLSLFCAYPKSGFSKDTFSSLRSICCEHHKLVGGITGQGPGLYYQEIDL